MIEYKEIFISQGVHYLENNYWLISGGMNDTFDSWPLIISIKAIQMRELLENILPIVREKEIPFKIIKHDSFHRQINENRFVDKESRAIMLFPAKISQVYDIKKLLKKGDSLWRAPFIPNARRIGKLLYALPQGQELPVPVDKQFQKMKERRRIGKYYLLHSILSDRPKGRTIKAINLKKFAFNWCIIKEGRMAMGEDEQGREIRDRLIWEKKLMTEFGSIISVPKVIDFLDQDENSYLVTEYIEGSLFQNAVDAVYHNQQTWRHHETTDKRKLLGYFWLVLELVESMHQLGYIHRDITDSNFIITKKGKLVAVDFELSCSLKEKMPDPPFVMGTEGYASPQQLRGEAPSIKDDIYSLGAFLIFILTDRHPKEILIENKKGGATVLFEATNDIKLVQLAEACVREDAVDRPPLRMIKSSIEEYMKML